MPEEQGGKILNISNFLKLIGALAVFIPLLAGYFQYRQSVQQDLDNNFRTVIEKLSSEKTEERLAAASSMGTFISEGSVYGDEAINLLVNRLSMELDYNVLNAIRGSLLKINKEDYPKVIDKILDLERNIGDQVRPLETRTRTAKRIFLDVQRTYLESQPISDSSNFKLPQSRVELDLNLKEYMIIKKDSLELDLHKQVAADFLSTLLSKITRSTPIEGIEFNFNSLNYVNMIELNFSEARFERCALSASNILDTRFVNSIIRHTTFAYSDLSQSHFENCIILNSVFADAALDSVDFSGSRFKDVFFKGSDLTGTNFSNVKGLKPIYFYGTDTLTLSKAIFDPEFKGQLKQEFSGLTYGDFEQYVRNSQLVNVRKTELLGY